MCPDKCCDKQKDPQECTPEQIKDCHGDDKEHSCCEEKEKEKEE